MKKSKHIFKFITSILIILNACLTTSHAMKKSNNPDDKINPTPSYYRSGEQPVFQSPKYYFSSFEQTNTESLPASKNTPCCVNGTEVPTYEIFCDFPQQQMITSKNLDKYFEVNYSLYYYTDRPDGSCIFCRRLFIKPKNLVFVLQKEVLEQYLNERKEDILKRLCVKNSKLDNILDAFDLIVIDRKIFIDKDLHYVLDTPVWFKDFDCASTPPQVFLMPDHLYANFELYIKRCFIEFESKYCPSILYLVKRDSLFPV